MVCYTVSTGRDPLPRLKAEPQGAAWQSTRLTGLVPGVASYSAIQITVGGAEGEEQGGMPGQLMHFFPLVHFRWPGGRTLRMAVSLI